MSTHKSFDKICRVVLAVTLLLTVLFMNAESFGVQKASAVMGYESKLFDTSTVHTIDIIMDDWEEFIANCKGEEYYSCSVVIDNDAYKNVAIRGKGNTSLTQVESYGNDRYSFKIEFNHYDVAKTYYGLDKLCLNNIIQDNTYMKDYLCYRTMAETGVASPLCSFVYITVNGEDWGLYLAVEGVEESFLQRNYGKDYGEIYKPDSQIMGGGRGNGKKFDMDGFFGNNTESDNTDSADTPGGFDNNSQPPTQRTPNDTAQSKPDENGQMPGNMRGGKPDGNMQGGQMPGKADGRPTPPDFPGGETPVNPDSGNTRGGMTPPEPENDTDTGDSAFDTNVKPQHGGAIPEMDGRMPDGGRGGMVNGSDDVLLKYIDDNIDSYANIFNNAKTDITDSDKERLITALKKLSAGEDLTNTVDVEKVIRYFVAHNFVLNFDSYTGSMIHNYYLYEKDGQMEMIPWDYNLAFGGFESADNAENLVNYPIDSPVSGGNTEDRPMLAWIFANEEYTELYHQYFAEFISEYFDSGYFENMIDSVSSMIAPFVEKDPTKFCSYEEFEKGVSTLKEFCLLRAESITGQLNGTIGSTSDTQKSDTLIHTGDLQISDMGSMHNVADGMGRPDGNIQIPQDGHGNFEIPELPIAGGEANTSEDNLPQYSFGQIPPNYAAGRESNFDGTVPGMPYEKGRIGEPDRTTANPVTSLIWIGISVCVLALGLVFVILFRRRKAF